VPVRERIIPKPGGKLRRSSPRSWSTGRRGGYQRGREPQRQPFIGRPRDEHRGGKRSGRRIAPRGFAAWAHRRFGHGELDLAERWLELDDAYDRLQYTDMAEYAVDAD
jgi:hypothetical protein